VFYHALGEHRPDLVPDQPLERAFLAAVVFCMTLTFYPIAKAFSLGQVQTWINSLFALLVWLWMARRPVPAGIVGGIICAIKPQLGLLLVWGLMRRQWNFSAAFAATLSVFLLVTLALYGIEHNLSYLDVLQYMSRHGEAFHANQSVNGLLNRLFGTGNDAGFDSTDFPAFHPAVYVGTLATSLIIVVAALFFRSSEHRAETTHDLLIAALSFTLASPIAWEHHFGVLMPMFAVLLPVLLRWPVAGRWTIPILAFAYILTSNFLNISHKFAGKTLLTPVQSYLLAGALIVLFLLYIARHAAARGLPATDQHVVDSNEEIAPAATIA
jgi:hypothetical protein